MTVADWKAALLTLNDGPFFDLMRSYLGDIRTPFNKQRLVDDLEGFLGRKDIQEAVSAYMDASDRTLISAVEQLGAPSADELASFFEGEFTFAELHAILLNLEERLVIYRFDDGGGRRLALNPALAPVLEPLATDPGPLFPSYPAEESPAGDSGLEGAVPSDESADSPESIPDDLFLAGVISHLRRLPDLFRADGEYRKKAAEDAAGVFRFEAFAAAVGAFHALGLAVGEDEGVRIDDGRLGSFAALRSRDRLLYLAAGLCGFFLEESAGKPRSRIARDRLALWARLFKSFCWRLEPDRKYPVSTLNRFLELALREAAAPRRRRWDTRGPEQAAEVRGGAEPSVYKAAALRALEISGILVPCADGTRRISPRMAESASPATAEASFLSVDSAFSVLVHPEIPFDSALSLGRFLDIRESGRISRYELTRESAVRGFDLGLSITDILSALESGAGRSVPQNVRWSVKDWHDRYSSAAVYRGVVLTLAENRRFILEAAPVAGMVSRELAPGVYLLNVDSEDDAVRLLESAGCDIVALPSPAQPESRTGAAVDVDPSRFAVFADLDRAGNVAPRPFHSGGGTSAVSAAEAGDPAPSPADRQTRLRAALDRKNLPKDQRDELAARVDRRVILAESQLVGAAVRYEKLEAKGLDYVGKVRVAEQALAAQSLVELFWRGPKGEPCRALGSPVSLEKSGGEVELSLDPAPRGERIRIAVGKISLIRRIKRSIFGE